MGLSSGYSNFLLLLFEFRTDLMGGSTERERYEKVPVAISTPSLPTPFSI